MRHTRYLILASALVGLGSASCGTFADDCFSGKECAGAFGKGGSSSTSSGMGGDATTTSSNSSTSTGVIPGCGDEIVDGAALETMGVISDKCGVFVQIDAAAGGTGSSAKPYKSIQEAIAAASGKNVYVCKSADPKMVFSEAVTIQDPVAVYGGFDCKSGWKFHAADRSALTAPVNVIPLSISAQGVTIANLAITTAQASGPGKSSVAVLASAATVTFDACDIEAKDGVPGADGDPGAPLMGGNVPPATAGTPGANGTLACADLDMNGTPDTTLAGGVGPMNSCATDPSVGGDGGSSKQSNGNPGTPGVTGAFGANGIGQPVSGVWSCSGAEPNGGGDAGDVGKDGDPGPAGKGIGKLVATGYQGTDGTSGKAGTSGQGGGGGGGAKGGMAICSGGKPGAGASGGGGGAGGCGGGGGKGGAAGGSSIAIASLGSKVTLKDSSLKTGNGGAGGKGGDLQSGGDGGNPGAGQAGSNGSSSSCDGGKGGTGGKGGPGGGGQGGHSIGIAYVGTAPTQVGKVVVKVGNLGAGGLGGNASIQMNDGDHGAAVEQQVFP